jgi:hypothetical protein
MLLMPRNCEQDSGSESDRCGMRKKRRESEVLLKEVAIPADHSLAAEIAKTVLKGLQHGPHS